MDDFTRQHLTRWLENQYRDEQEVESARTRILSLYDSDPEYWSTQDWSRMDDESLYRGKK